MVCELDPSSTVKTGSGPGFPSVPRPGFGGGNRELGKRQLLLGLEQVIPGLTLASKGTVNHVRSSSKGHMANTPSHQH